MNDYVVSYLDCGCAMMSDGRRSWCPTCADGGPKVGPAEKGETTSYLLNSAFEDDYWTCEVCKADWWFPEGGPEENGMKFCPVCGRKITEFVRLEPEDEDDR